MSIFAILLTPATFMLTASLSRKGLEFSNYIYYSATVFFLRIYPFLFAVASLNIDTSYPNCTIWINSVDAAFPARCFICDHLRRSEPKGTHGVSVCEEGKLLVTNFLYMKLTLHIPLGHGCAGTNVPFVLGAVMLFVIVWYNDSDCVWTPQSL